MRLIILVGIVGSGKTSIATTQFKEYSRISQDDLGSRQACIQKFKELAEQGKSIIIDRCNHTRKQRAIWTNLAHSYSFESIDCIYLHINEEEAIARALSRKNHPTINNLPIEKVKSIVYNFNKELETVKLEEGFSSILIIRR